MKTGLNKCRWQSGSVMVQTLLLAVILVETLSGYLYWASTQSRQVAESQAWNAALAYAEAGIEEGLAQANYLFGTNYTDSARANWGAPGAGVYGPRTSTFTNGSYSAIIAASAFPTIIATGYTTVPIVGRQIKRTVQVTTTVGYAFGNAMVAMTDIDLKGNCVMVDSYDSSDPAHCTPNGLYDPATRKAGGDVCSVNGTVNVQNANVYGHVRTSPWGNAGTGPNGTVGDLNWSGPGIEPGWYQPDFNQTYPDVGPPFNPVGAWSVSAVNQGTNTYSLGTGDYYVNGDFKIQNNETLYISGNVRVWITGSLTMSGQSGSFITIAPGATLKLYVGNTSGSAVSATMTTVNNSGNAANFQFYGLANLTSASWSGNSVYVGTVYAPEAAFTLKGGGTWQNPYDYMGSCIVKQVVMNGHFRVHYDENLKRTGPQSGFIVTSWREI